MKERTLVKQPTNDAIIVFRFRDDWCESIKAVTATYCASSGQHPAKDRGKLLIISTTSNSLQNIVYVLTSEKERVYAGRELEKQTPHESNHPGNFKCHQYLHLVEKDLGTKNGPGYRLLLDVCIKSKTHDDLAHKKERIRWHHRY